MVQQGVLVVELLVDSVIAASLPQRVLEHQLQVLAIAKDDWIDQSICFATVHCDPFNQNITCALVANGVERPSPPQFTQAFIHQSSPKVKTLSPVRGQGISMFSSRSDTSSSALEANPK